MSLHRHQVPAYSLGSLGGLGAIGIRDVGLCWGGSEGAGTTGTMLCALHLVVSKLSAASRRLQADAGLALLAGYGNAGGSGMHSSTVAVANSFTRGAGQGVRRSV